MAALKQLAGNSGYHFQLLTSVIEVNELQKRRVIGKLKKHLGSLEGKRGRPARPGLQAETDDMQRRPAWSWPAACCRGGRGRAYDPVVDGAGERLHGVIMSATAEEAVTGADAAVLGHRVGRDRRLDWASGPPTRCQPVLIDGRNALDPDGDDRGPATRTRASAGSPR